MKDFIDALDNVLDDDIDMAGQNITILLLIQDGATDRSRHSRT